MQMFCGALGLSPVSFAGFPPTEFKAHLRRDSGEQQSGLKYQ
jgi:hypothetical protein